MEFRQVQYLNFTYDHFWIKKYINLNPPKKNFKRTLLLSYSYVSWKNVCPSPLPSLKLFQLPISVGVPEKAERVSRLEWESYLFFLKLLPWDSNMHSGSGRKEVSHRTGGRGLVTDAQEEYHCNFSLWTEFKIIYEIVNLIPAQPPTIWVIQSKLFS